MVGLGGGFLIVPILIFFFNLNSHEAVGTSMVMVIFTALSSTFAYARQKRIDYGVGLKLAIGTVPGALVGAYLTMLVSGELLTAMFGVFLLFVAFQIARTGRNRNATNTGSERNIVDAKGIRFNYMARVAPGLPISFLGGVVSGFFGVGGGTVLVPVMAIVVGMPMHIAIAGSMFIMCFTSISGAVTHLTLGNVVPEYALYLSIGIIFGTQIGAAVARRLKSQVLRKVFAASLVVVGIRMILTII
jgi:hypothetical protein